MTEEVKGTTDAKAEQTPPVGQATAGNETGPQAEGSKPKARSKPPKTDSQPRTGGTRPFTWLVIILALLTALAAAAGSAYLWQLNTQQAEQLAKLRSEQSQDMATLAGRDGQLESRLGRADDALAQLQRRDEALESSLQSLFKQLGQDRNTWTLDEVDYLLVIANRRLQLDGDVKSALTALNEADKRLQDQADPALLPVREAIATEIQALRALPIIDVEGIALELASLARRVEQLALPGDSQQRFTPKAVETLNTPVSDWQGLLLAMWTDIKGLVSIRNSGVEAVPLRVPEQRYYLRQNLMLKLETARLALLQHNEATYQDALGEAAAWTGQYFNSDDTATQGFIEAVTGLQAQRLKQALPNIDGSLRSLRQVRKRLEREAQQALKTVSGAQAS